MDKGKKRIIGGVGESNNPPYVAPFDPKTQLEGYKRGQIAAEKRQQELEDAEMLAVQQRKFKALPLPGGRPGEQQPLRQDKGGRSEGETQEEHEQILLHRCQEAAEV